MFSTEFTPREKLIKAKIQLRESHRVFYGLLAGLELIENNKIPTLAVDGSDIIYYNADFVDKESVSDLKVILVHELLHLVFGHPKQRQPNKQMYGYAIDIKVNNILNNEGFKFSKPDECIWPKDNSYTLEVQDKDSKMHSIPFDNIDKDTFMNVYRKLENIIMPEDENNDSSGLGDHSLHQQGNEMSSKDQKKWATRIAQETMKNKGSMSEELERLFKSISAPDVEWNEILRDRIQGMQITDYTWSHPSKLFFATGIYLPGYKREDFRMIVAIDTSGSVSDKELNKALSEIYGIYDSHPSCELDILIGDTELKEHKKIYPGQRDEILAMKNKGGGGTSHKFVFDWIKNSNSNPNVLVLFTDGYSDIEDCMDSIKPEYEVIFVWDKNFNNRIEGYGYKVTIGD